MKTLENTSKFLRIAGCGAIVMASINFLMSGRYDLNSLNTHYLFLGLNLLLTIMGILSWKKFKDGKTSRTFIGLSLAMVPVQMAQLGAFIYSKFEGARSYLPEMLKLNLPGDTSLIFLSLMTLAVLVPISYLGFGVLNRKNTKSLCTNFLLGSIILLVPTRASLYTAALISLSLFISSWAIFKPQVNETFETKLSTLLTLIPTTIVLGRSFFYPQDIGYFAILSSSLAAFLFFVTPRLTSSIEKAATFQDFSLPMILLSLVFWSISMNFNLSVAGIVGVIIISLLSFKSIRKAKDYRMAAGVLLIPVMFSVFSQYSLVLRCLSLALPITLLTLAITKKEKTNFKTNMICLILFTSLNLLTIVKVPSISAWQILSIMGVGLIVFAGIFEKKYPVLKERFNCFYHTLD